MKKISKETWRQVHTAYAQGISLREIAVNMGIPKGTVLAKAFREKWTAQIQTAKSQAMTTRDESPDVLQAVCKSLADDEQATKSALSREIARAARRAKLDDVSTAQELHSLVRSAAMLHGWEQNNSGQIDIGIQVL